MGNINSNYSQLMDIAKNACAKPLEDLDNELLSVDDDGSFDEY